MSDTKRLEGEIRNYDVVKNFGFIEFVNKYGREQSLFYTSRNCQYDWKGSRAWAFGRCTPVSFMIARRNGKTHAEDVAPIFPMSEPEDLAGYRESSEMVSKHFDYVFLKRADGDALFLHLEDVVDQHKYRWNLLEAGTPVYHGVRFDDGTQRWRAAYAELYSAEELQSFKQEWEPEPEPQTVIKAEPVPGSLKPRQQIEDVPPARAGKEGPS